MRPSARKLSFLDQWLNRSLAFIPSWVAWEWPWRTCIEHRSMSSSNRQWKQNKIRMFCCCSHMENVSQPECAACFEDQSSAKTMIWSKFWPQPSSTRRWVWKSIRLPIMTACSAAAENLPASSRSRLWERRNLMKAIVEHLFDSAGDWHCRGEINFSLQLSAHSILQINQFRVQCCRELDKWFSLRQRRQSRNVIKCNDGTR